MGELLLVDSDILIDAGRGMDEAIEFLQRLEAESRLAVSAVTQMELTVGCRNKTELRALDQFLARFEIVSLDEIITNTAVNLLQTYHLSHGLLIADALIAATALTLRAPLATKNRRDYRFITAVELMKYP